MAESAIDSYFDTPERAERLALVSHLLHNTELVPCVRGPDGAGKSHFAERLAEHLGEQAPALVIDAAAAVDIRQVIFDGLGLAPGPWPSAIADMPANDHLVLLVDDADLLTAAQCSDLSALNDGGVHLVFLIDDAAPPPLGDWRVQTVDLPPFDAEQARDFLLAAAPSSVAGWTDAQWQQAWQRADGQPGPLLELALTGMPQAVVGAGLWKWLLGGAAALLVVLVLWQQERINALFTGPDRAVPPPAETPVESVVAGDPSALAIPPLAEPANAPDAAVELPARQHIRPEEAAPETVASEEPSPAPVVAAEPAHRSVEEPSAVAVPIRIERPAELATEATAPDVAGPVPMNELVPPVPALLEEPEPELLPEPVQAPMTSPVPATPPVAPAPPPVVAPPPKPPTAPKPPAVSKPAVLSQPRADDDLAWLRSRSASRYTLQLLGARDRAAVDKFIRQHGLTGKYAVFARDLGGKPWYSLVYGDYKDRDAAIRGRAALPAGLRRDDVWPRTFASVWAQLPGPAAGR